MRWDNLRLDDQLAADQDPAAGETLFPAERRDVALPLIERGAVARTFDTPGFRGMTFYEVQAKSVVNRVPEASRMPFRWTINPYRGCQHSCVYCYARKSHSYLELDTGADFDTKVVVKVNAPELVRKKMASPSWQGEHIAMGTNVDCYQRAEGRYQLMPGIIGALKDAANPFSILTKGTLILRDIDLLAEAAEVTDVGLNVSVGFIDKELWRSVEPGTPAPARRLEACAALNERGLALRRAHGAGGAVPVRLPRPARRGRQPDRGGRRHARDAHRAAPAPGHPGVVLPLAGGPSPRPGRPVPRPVRPERLRPEGLPGQDRRPGPRARGQARHRPAEARLRPRPATGARARGPAAPRRLRGALGLGARARSSLPASSEQLTLL